MKKIITFFTFILVLCLLTGFILKEKEKTEENQGNSVVTCNPDQAESNTNNQSLRERFMQTYDLTDITEQITTYLQEYINNQNFRMGSEEYIVFANKSVNYVVYFGSDDSLKVELQTQGSYFTEEEKSDAESPYYFDVESDGTIVHKSMQGADTLRYENVGKGTLLIGDPYEPVFEDFEGKDKMIQKMKDYLEEKYFGDVDIVDAPIFAESTEAKTVYVMNFNEVNVAENYFDVLVETVDFTYYQAEMFYDESVKEYSCEELEPELVVNGENELEDEYIEQEKQYYNRVKENAIITLNGLN